MGRGIAVKNSEGEVFAPFDGEVTALFPQAIALEFDDGINIFIHVGIDTVKLNGKFFTAKVEDGNRIRRGQLLLEFDTAKIRKAGYSITTPVVVTNHTEFGDITFERLNKFFLSQ